MANPAAHTYDVRATLDNAAGELLPGMVCRVTVSPAESAEEIAVPLRAVQQAGDGSRFVWTVRGDSAVRTAVTTGRLVNNGIVLTGASRRATASSWTACRRSARAVKSYGDEKFE